MKVEFTNVTGFKSWYDNKQEVIQSDDFKFFHAMRKAIVHINRVKPNKKVSISIIEWIPITDGVQATAIKANEVTEEHSSEDRKKTGTSGETHEKNASLPFESLNKKSSSDEMAREVVRFFLKYPEKNLINLCEKYLQNLTILADECEQLFNKTK